MQWESQTLSYQIVRSQRRKKTVSISVHPDGGVRVAVPAAMATAEVDAMVLKDAAWISQKLEFYRSQDPPAVPSDFVTGEPVSYLGVVYYLAVDGGSTGSVHINGQHIHVPITLPAVDGLLQATQVRSALIAWFFDQACQFLPQRIRHWCSTIGLPLPHAMVADQKRCWGSCGPGNTIRLNWRIMQSPVRLVDYVVVHELMHMIHANHSRHYWRTVASVMPDYKDRRKELKLRYADLDW